MKYQIDTILVLDAVKKDCECPFCLIQKSLDDKYVNYYLGNTIMQGYIRIRIHYLGFCSMHYEKMLKSNSKFSLGLITTTHMDEILENIKASTNILKNKICDTKNTAKSIDILIDCLNNTYKKL